MTKRLPIIRAGYSPSEVIDELEKLGIPLLNFASGKMPDSEKILPSLSSRMAGNYLVFQELIMSTSRFALLGLTVCVLTSGCDLPTNPPASDSLSLSVAESSANRNARWKDADHHRLADLIPGYGGYFIDESGRAVVYLKDRSAIPAAAKHVALHAKAHNNGYPITGIEYREAKYEFNDLASWREAFPKLLTSLEGVVFVGVSKRHNRVHVGVKDAATRDMLFQTITRGHLPADAFELEIAAPFHPEVDSLTSHAFTLEGGRQIWSEGGWNGNPGTCTLGLVGRGKAELTDNYYVGGYWGFTASHCTASMNGVSFRDFRQPWSNSGYVATEDQDGVEYFGTTYDYNGDSYVCNYAGGCRNSDVALVELYNRSFSVGRVARPKNNTGSLELSISNPYFTVIGMAISRYNTGTVDKIGAAGGWRTGTVIGTCYDAPNWPVQGTNTLTLECTSLANYASQSGDSGAPILQTTFNGSIVVGFHAGSNGTYAVFTTPVAVDEDWAIAPYAYHLPFAEIEWRYGY